MSIEAQYIPYAAVPTLGRGRALIFAPHPDDEVFGCAGAIRRHVADGDAVRVVVVTDGGFGAGEAGLGYVQARQEESRAAARVLGYGEPIFWGLPDRGLVFDEALIERVQKAVTDFGPALVYAPSWWEIHPDHTALALAVTEALRRTEEPPPLAMYEVGVPLHPNRLLDITESLAHKRAAIACFGSQMAHQAYDDHILALNRYRTYTLPPAVQAAEAYRLVDSLAELPEAPRLSRAATPLCAQENLPQGQDHRRVTRVGGTLRGLKWRWLMRLLG